MFKIFLIAVLAFISSTAYNFYGPLTPAQKSIVENRPVARLFCGGGQIGQILGPFMITGGLSCDRVEFGHFGGGQMTPLTPPGYGPAKTCT